MTEYETRTEEHRFDHTPAAEMNHFLTMVVAPIGMKELTALRDASWQRGGVSGDEKEREEVYKAWLSDAGRLVSGIFQKSPHVAEPLQRFVNERKQARGITARTLGEPTPENCSKFMDLIEDIFQVGMIAGVLVRGASLASASDAVKLERFNAVADKLYEYAKASSGDYEGASSIDAAKKFLAAYASVDAVPELRVPLAKRWKELSEAGKRE